MAKQVNIGLVQTACEASKKSNIQKAVSYIEQLAADNAQIVCLQEVFNSIYFPQNISVDNFSAAEAIPGYTTNELAKVAKRFNMYIIVPLFEVDNRHYYNTAAVLGPEGEIVGKYRKTHIPLNNGYQEKYYFRPGNLGYPVFETPFCKFGISICWDHWFVENQRAYGLQGCQIIFSPTAIGFCDFKDLHIDKDYFGIWQTMLKGQCIQNGCYMAIVNRVGQENAVSFFGNSAIYGPRGDTVLQLTDKESAVVQTIDLSVCDTWTDQQQFHRDWWSETYKIISRSSINEMEFC